jgi:glycosyltransferase involved in cell wall biosynthesis
LREEAGQNSHIKFPGVVPEAETRELYAGADIFCLPCIRPADGDGDGIPTSVLEAMAFELPIVTSDLLSAPYYVRHEKEGLLTPPGDIEAISSALETLCVNPRLRRDLGRAGRVRVSSLCDIEKNIMKLENIMIKTREPGHVFLGQEGAKPLVSIAITCFNRGRFIRQCINSALAQTYPNVEVVVVDDGSTDETIDILKEYGDSIRFECLGQNRGPHYAKNRAFLMTSEASRYVAILDSDDFFHPDFVKTCVHYLETHPEIGMVYTDNTLVDAEGRVLQNQHAVSPWSIDSWLRTRGLRGDNWVARRDLVMKTDLHDVSLNLDEDFDLFYQLLELTTFAHQPGYLVYIRQHNEQISGRRFELAMCHAANLVKYGYSPEYAYLRARYNPEWIPSIEKGIALGKKLRQKIKEKREKNA